MKIKMKHHLIVSINESEEEKNDFQGDFIFHGNLWPIITQPSTM